MEKKCEKMVSVLLVACMMLALAAGCGGKDTAGNEKEPDVAVSEEKAVKFSEKDLEGIVSGIEDRYILKGSEEIDYLYGVVYDEEIVTDIQADASEVDPGKTGTYKAVYTVTVDGTALENHLEGNASDQKKGKKDIKTEEIAIEKKVEVVDGKKAQELADKDKAVWKDKNETVKKSDGTEAEQTEAETKIENAAPASDKNDVGSSQTSKKEDNKNNGNSANSAGNKTSNSNGNNTASNGGSGSASQHTHNWVAQTKMVHHDATGHYETQVIQAAYDEPVYEPRVICGCGASFASEASWQQHSIDGCVYGYSVGKVQTGSIHHDAVTQQVWVQDSAAWDETVTTGYRCSGCGATK